LSETKLGNFNHKTANKLLKEIEQEIKNENITQKIAKNISVNQNEILIDNIQSPLSMNSTRYKSLFTQQLLKDSKIQPKNEIRDVS